MELVVVRLGDHLEDFSPQALILLPHALAFFGLPLVKVTLRRHV
jgi:hypothetical protein